MGWFDTFINGAKNVAGVILDHASDIGKVVSTVAKVAGMVMVEGEQTTCKEGSATAQTWTGMPDLINMVRDAEQNLAKAAQQNSDKQLRTLKETRPEAPWTDYQDVSTTMTGLWSKPMPIDDFGNPSQEMASDISHMLEEVGFPQSITVTPGKAPIDVAQAIGAGLFSKPPVDPLNLEANSEGVPWSVVKAGPYVSSDNKRVLLCSHAYYAVPTGSSTEPPTWHSAVNFTTKMTLGAKKELQRQRRERFYASPRYQMSAEELGDMANVWQVTLRILWLTATHAAKAATILPEILNKLLAPTGKIILEYSIDANEGMTTRLTISIRPPGTPMQGRNAVESAVNATVERLTGAELTALSDETYEPKAGGMTKVEIVQSSLLSKSVSAPGTSKPTKQERGLADQQALAKLTGSHPLMFNLEFDPAQLKANGNPILVPVYPFVTQKDDRASLDGTVVGD